MKNYTHYRCNITTTALFLTLTCILYIINMNIDVAFGLPFGETTRVHTPISTDPADSPNTTSSDFLERENLTTDLLNNPNLNHEIPSANVFPNDHDNPRGDSYNATSRSDVEATLRRKPHDSDYAIEIDDMQLLEYWMQKRFHNALYGIDPLVPRDWKPTNVTNTNVPSSPPSPSPHSTTPVVPPPTTLDDPLARVVVAPGNVDNESILDTIRQPNRTNISPITAPDNVGNEPRRIPTRTNRPPTQPPPVVDPVFTPVANDPSTDETAPLGPDPFENLDCDPKDIHCQDLARVFGSDSSLITLPSHLHPGLDSVLRQSVPGLPGYNAIELLRDTLNFADRDDKKCNDDHLDVSTGSFRSSRWHSTRVSPRRNYSMNIIDTSHVSFPDFDSEPILSTPYPFITMQFQTTPNTNQNIHNTNNNNGNNYNNRSSNTHSNNNNNRNNSHSNSNPPSSTLESNLRSLYSSNTRQLNMIQQDIYAPTPDSINSFFNGRGDASSMYYDNEMLNFHRQHQQHERIKRRNESREGAEARNRRSNNNNNNEHVHDHDRYNNNNSGHSRNFRHNSEYFRAFPPQSTHGMTEYEKFLDLNQRAQEKKIWDKYLLLEDIQTALFKQNARRKQYYEWLSQQENDTTNAEN